MPTRPTAASPIIKAPVELMVMLLAVSLTSWLANFKVPLIVNAPRLGVSAFKMIVVPTGITTAAPAPGSVPPQVAVSAQFFGFDALMVLAGAGANAVCGPASRLSKLVNAL